MIKRDGKSIRIGIKGKILTGFILLLFIFAGVMLTVSSSQMKNLGMNEIKDKLNDECHLAYEYLNIAYPGEWKVDGSNLYKGSKLINGDEAFVNTIKESTGSLATVFLGDIRISTNVTGNDGKRAVGTKADEKVANTVLKDGREYNGEANVVGESYETTYMPIRDSSGKAVGMLFIGVEKKGIEGQINQMNLIIGLAAAAMIILGFIAAGFIAGSVIRNIKEVLGSLKRMETGDLSLSINSNSKDETGLIINYLESVRKGLRELISGMKENSALITEHSEKLASTADVTAKSIAAVSQTADELARGASEQARNAQNGAEKLTSLAEEIKSAVNSADLVKMYSSQTKDESDMGMSSLNALESKFQINEEFSRKTADNVEKLAGRSNSIGEIIVAIQSIAQQTNLLALNAAIEAARAGEAGRGFSVVADEIRKLSGQTSNSAKQIEDIIVKIQEEIKTVKENMDSAGSAVAEANSALNDSKQAYRSISEAINGTIGQIDNLTEKVRKIDKNKDTVLTAIEEISAISQESAASTQEVSASMGEQSRSIEEVLQAADNLKTIVNNLETAVKRFII
jgi:Methyl-accepting chemotaxis protein